MRAGHTPLRYKTKHLKTNEFRAVVEFKGMQFVGKPKRNKQLVERDAAIEALGWLTARVDRGEGEAGASCALDLGVDLVRGGSSWARDFAEVAAGHAAGGSRRLKRSRRHSRKDLRA
jgi:hypothetical protein